MMRVIARALVALILLLAPIAAHAQGVDAVARGLAASALPVKAVPSLADLGAPSSQPFVIVCAGQSNATGSDPGGNVDTAGNSTAAFDASLTSGVLNVTTMLTLGNVYNYNVPTATGTAAALADQNGTVTAGTTVTAQITSTTNVGTFTASVPANSNQLTVNGSVTGAAIALNQLIFGGVLPANTYILSGSGNSWTLSQNNGSTAIVNASLSVGTAGQLGTYQTSGTQTVASEYMGTGSKTVGPNIWMTSGGTGATWLSLTSVVQAAFGVPPLNVMPYGFVSAPALNENNMCLAAANEIRAKSNLPASRPIVILWDCYGGQSISDWVDQTPINMWSVLTNGISLINAKYGTGWYINLVVWAQSGQDIGQVTFNGYVGPNSNLLTLTGNAVASNGTSFALSTIINAGATNLANNTEILTLASGTLGQSGSTYTLSNGSQTVGSSGAPVALSTGSIYGSQSLYAAAYARLQADFQALPQWSVNTRVIDMMEPIWYDAGSSARNDFHRTLIKGAVYPYIDVVNPTQCAESMVVPGPHFAGSCLVQLGKAIAHAYLTSAPSANYHSDLSYYGSEMAFWNALTASSGTSLGIDDIFTGAVIGSGGGSWYLPNPNYARTPLDVVCNATSTIYSPGVTTPFQEELNGFGPTAAQSSVPCPLQQSLHIVPQGGSWFVYPIGYQEGTTIDHVQYIDNSGTSTNVGSANLRGFLTPSLQTPITMTPPLGAVDTITNDPTATGPASIAINSGASLQGPDGLQYTTSNPYYIYPGDVVVIEAGYDINNQTKYWVKSDLQWFGKGFQKTTQQTGAGSTSSIATVGSSGVGNGGGNQLTLTSITSGTFYPGTKISGSGFSADYILNQETSTVNNGTASCTIPANSNVMTCGTVTGTAIAIGDLASGNGLPAGDYVLSGTGPWTMSQYVVLPVSATVTFGTPGGAGTYTLVNDEPSGISPGTTINGQTGELTLGGTITGYTSIGDVLSGTSVPALDYITYQISGTAGGAGVYAVSQITAVSSTAITATAYLQCLSGFGSLYVANIPGATVSAETIALPLTPKGGQAVDLYFASAVTALTFSPAASTFTNATAVTAGSKLSFKYDAITGAWE